MRQAADMFLRRHAIAVGVAAGLVAAVAFLVAYAAAADAWIDPGAALLLGLVATWLLAAAGKIVATITRQRKRGS